MTKQTAQILDLIYVPPSPDWQFPLHEHDHAELSLVLRGTGHFYCSNREWTVPGGSLILKNPGLAHWEKSDPVDPMEQICLSLHLPDREGRLLPEGYAPVLDVSSHLELFSSLLRYLRDHHTDPACADAARDAVTLLLDLTDLAVARCAPLQAERPLRREEIPKKVREYLDEHYREPLKIPELAERFYISEGYLSRQFKKATGFTVNEYVLSKRMREAQKMLLFGNESIKEIALSCGYEDLQYFYHVFRKYARCTPAQFREMYRESGAMD